MSIYGNPVMLGGSGGGGGGGGNAYAYLRAPTSADGENGQYWFQLYASGYGANFNPTDNASVASGGWEFTANSAITVTGARAKVRKTSYSGTVKLADSSGNVLAEKTISLVAGDWASVDFDAPVTLTAGQNYIIMLFGNSGTLTYTRLATAISSITYVRGRYNGLPGTQESGIWYGVDILIQAYPPYPVSKQYYKSGGTWSEVT